MAAEAPLGGPRARWATHLGLGFNVLVLSAVSFFTDVSSEIIFPLLPLYLISTQYGGLGLGSGFGLLIVGALEGLREATASLLKVFSGHWSDRLGRRKALVTAGYGLSGLLKLAFPFVRVWEALVGVAVAERIGKGLRDAPRDAILADSSPHAVRGKVFGFHRTADTAGATLGPILAFLLFASLGFQGVFLVATLPAMISVLLVFLIREERRLPSTAPTLFISLRALSPPLKLFLLVATVFTLGDFSVFFLLVQVVQGSGGATGDPAAFALAVQGALVLYLVFNITYAALSIPAGHLSDRRGRLFTILLGYTAFGATALGFILVGGSPWLLLPLFILFGIAYALFQGVQRAFVADLASPELRATSLGTYHTLTGLAKFPASFIFGGLWALWGSPASFTYVACTSASAVALLLVMMKRHPRASLTAIT